MSRSKKTDRIWIAWEYHPRNRSLSTALNARLFEMVSAQSRLIKFPRFIILTIKILISERPRVLFVENPSIILSILAVALRLVFRYTLIVDEHNAGFFPIEGKSTLLNALARFVIRKANFVIVTNRELRELAKRWGGCAVVCPDPLPYLKNYTMKGRNRNKGECFNLFFVCSWTDDEPYSEVFEAIKACESSLSVNLWVSGNYTGKVNPDRLPKNIKLLGYVSNDEYYSSFAHCDAAMILTRRNNCLNCGAYEAVSLGKPGILSDTQVLKEYFNKGFVYTKIDSKSIGNAIKCLVDKHQQLISDVSILYSEIESKGNKDFRAIDQLVERYESR